MASSKELNKIKDCISRNKLGYSHYTLALFINQTLPDTSSFELWLCVLVQQEVEQGNVCISVESLYDKSNDLGWKEIPQEKELQHLLNHSLVVGNENEIKPLILDRQRLYLNRFYHNEKFISDSLLLRANSNKEINAQVKTKIDHLFENSRDIDLQKLALINSLRHSLSIISGGPGTGKTWTVGKILEVLIQQQNNRPLNIKLAAPTGKAAARLSESIRSLRSNMQFDDAVNNQFPEQAITLHRLLGIHRYTHRAKFNQQNLLDCDVLVLDEASMIDQQMMAAVCKALPTGCKLILLGDKDQLSSVEAGSVFADLCGGLKQTCFSKQQSSWLEQQFGVQLESKDSRFALTDNVVVLQHSRRFDDQSAIGQFARLINQGDAKKSLLLLKQQKANSGLYWQSLESTDILENIKQQNQLTYKTMMSSENVQQAFERFHQYQILCAVWAGPTGVNYINELIEGWLKSENDIPQQEEYFQGKALIMTSNHYQYNIHNGDIGIVWPDEQGQLRVYFETSEEEVKALSLSQCPQHKPAYAMTIHKSQGSEFNHVLMVLPETITPVTTRELLYTGITRAVDTVEIWAPESIVSAAIQQKTMRVSGLKDRLSVSLANS